MEINIFAMPEIAEAGNAGEQPARNNQANGDDGMGVAGITPSSPESSLLLIPKKTHSQNEETDLNSFEKTLQFKGV